MSSTTQPVIHAAADLLSDVSLEMTGADLAALVGAREVIAPGTSIHVTHLGTETLEQRLAAASAVLEHGWRPVPHIASRRLRSAQELEHCLGRLGDLGAADRLMVVAGDPETPEGPFEDSLAVIGSGILQRHGVTHVTITGYPDGHPGVAEHALWRSLEDKSAALAEQGIDGAIVTQFGFDTESVLRWIRAVRERGIDLPIRVGVAGPAGVKRLLGYARRFGVSTSAGIVKKYGFSLANLLGTAGPDHFVSALAGELNGAQLGSVRLHFYTFGGMVATSEWIDGYRNSSPIRSS